MKTSMAVTLGAAALATAVSAQAALVNATFSGTVSSQTASSFAVGAAVGGSFSYDTTTGRYRSFDVAGQSVMGADAATPSFVSTASFTPDRYSAIYRAQVSPVAQGGTLNSSFSVDLEALLRPWASATPIALLTDTTELASNFDRPSSSFGYYTANADGTDIRALTARFGTLTVTTPVPEPSTAALMFAGGAILLGARRLRRDA